MVGGGLGYTSGPVRGFAQNYFFGELKTGYYFRAKISLIQ
jgi:hypothetical protein